jgi:hypothetical protein
MLKIIATHLDCHSQVEAVTSMSFVVYVRTMVVRYAVTNHDPVALISPTFLAASAENSSSTAKPETAYRVIDAAIFSAAIMMGALMLADGTFGRIDPSTIRSLLR